MIKIIKLQLSNGRLSNREPFLIKDNEELKLDFISPHTIQELLVTLSNGELQGNYNCIDNLFTVPREFLTPGVLDISVALIKNNQTVKQWTVEPIILQEAPQGLQGHLELEELRKLVTDLTNKVERVKVSTEKVLTGQANKILSLETEVRKLKNDPLRV